VNPSIHELEQLYAKIPQPLRTAARWRLAYMLYRGQRASGDGRLESLDVALRMSAALAYGRWPKKP
jgi:hypothetical protein